LDVHKTELPGSRVELKVQLAADEVDDAYAAVFQELSDRGGIPGFRPGKAPAAIIRRRVNEDTLQELAWMRLVEQHYPEIVETEELEPLTDPSFPDLESLDFGENRPVSFTVSMTVRPRPKIEQYKGLHVFKPSAEVTEKGIDEALEELREAAAEEVETERVEVAEGDIVTATLTVIGEEADEPLSEGEQEFAIGSGKYSPVIDAEMVGKKIGDTVNVEHTYPDDYDDADLAGKQVAICATIDQIMERRLPDLDDEFAKSQGDFESLAALREAVSEQIARQLEDRARQEVENNALTAILAGTQVDLPESLVDQIAAGGFDRFQQRLEAEGLSLEAFTEIAQVSEDDVRANERVRAEAALKLELTLAEIGRLEDMELTDDDLEAEIKRFAAVVGADEGFVRQALGVQDGLEEELRERALRNKIVGFIVDNSEVEEVAREDYEEIKQREREKLEERAKAVAEAEEAVSEETTEDNGGLQPEGDASAESATEKTDEQPASGEGDE